MKQNRAIKFHSENNNNIVKVRNTLFLLAKYVPSKLTRFKHIQLGSQYVKYVCSLCVVCARFSVSFTRTQAQTYIIFVKPVRVVYFNLSYRSSRSHSKLNIYFHQFPQQHVLNPFMVQGISLNFWTNTISTPSRYQSRFGYSPEREKCFI